MYLARNAVKTVFIIFGDVWQKNVKAKGEQIN